MKDSIVKEKTIFNFQLIIVLLLFILGCNTETQKDKANIPKERLEGYKRQFEEADNDIEKLKALMKAACAADNVSESRKTLIQQLADFTETAPDCEMKVAAYNTLITLYEEIDISLPFIYYQKALELIPKFPQYKEVMEAEADIKLSNVYFVYGDYEYIQQHLFNAIHILEAIPEKDYQKIEDKTSISVCSALTLGYSTAVALYQYNDQNETAHEYARKQLALAEKNDNIYSKACAYCTYAYSLLLLDKIDEAHEYVEKAYKISMETQTVIDINQAYVVLACCEEAKGNIPGAISWAEKNLEYLKGKERPSMELDAYNGLSHSYKLIDDFEKTLDVSFKGLSLADSLKAKPLLACFHDRLGDVYAKRGNYKEAYNHQEKRIAIMEELRSEESTHQINFLTARYDAERREMKIQEMEEKAERHKIQLIIGFGICVLIISLLLVILRFRKRHNRLLAEMNATKDKFFSIISHDLKNPAIAQRDALEQMLKNTTDWNSDDSKKHLSDLLKSADEEVELLYNLLSWAQVQTGRMRYAPITFDLSTHLRGDLSLIRNMAESKKITLTDRIPDHVPIVGDINMILTVVRNLLTNAVKFTYVGGEILFTIEPASNGKHIVSVSDTGTGMTPEEIRTLFNIDNLQHRQGTIGEQGSGLGLIVCKELLDKHKSVLHVESEEGKGSRFWFEI